MRTELKPGERLIPQDVQTPILQIQLLRHQFVYEFVKKEIQPSDKVLDLGFGEGYGTAMLAEHCREIIGVDVSDKVVEYANHKYTRPNCRFIKYDGVRLPLDDNSLDIVVSFQVIEHIENDNDFISEIHRALKPAGKLYLTTPNKATRLKPGQKPFNRFHKREYYSRELAEVLGHSFSTVNIWGISATPEIHRIEFERIQRGGLLNFLINMGLRKLIPESVDLALSKLVGKLRGKRCTTGSDQQMARRFSLADFQVEKEKVDESLDLFAVCIK